jgi:glycosyltransferase involved in cell wall biosynthesis
MKILFLIPYSFVPPRSGNQNLTFNLLKYVTLHAFCDLVLLVDYGADEEAIRASIVSEFPTIGNIWIFIKPKGIILSVARLESMLHGYHPGIGRYKSNNLAVWLTSHIKKYAYDLVHFDMIHMSQYGKYCGDKPLLLVASDAYSNAARSAKDATDNKLQKFLISIYESLVRNYEKNEYRNFDTVCTVSKIDQNYLAEIVPSLNLRTIGIAIGEHYVEEAPRSFVKQEENQPNILCTGAISSPVVAECFLNFLEVYRSEIIKRVPGVSLTILGRNPTKKLMNCLQEFPSVNYVEYVPDYPSFLKKDWVYAYPQKCSSGLQTKVQQAMAIGLPVVGFEQAFGGLNVEDNKHCFICKNFSEFSKNIIDLLSNPLQRETIGKAAAEQIRCYFSIEKTGNQMLEICQETIKLKNN